MASPELISEEHIKRRAESVLSARLSRRTLLRSAVSASVLLALNEVSTRTASAQGGSGKSESNRFGILPIMGTIAGGSLGLLAEGDEKIPGVLAGAVGGFFTGVALNLVILK